MHLVIDVGNTRLKVALFEDASLKHFFVYKDFAQFFEAGILKRYRIDNCIFVSVVDNIEEEVAELKNHFPVIEYTISTPTPLKNNYKSVATLGPDRLVSVVAANFLYPSQDVLVVDFGTCIKYNFVNSKNEFTGGAISPGVSMRFRSLNAFTARLPLLEPDAGYDGLVGETTKDNILSGVLVGSVAEVNGFIARYKEVYPDLKVVMTGGDVELFEKKITSRHIVDTFLIMKGLNIILNYNLTPPKTNDICI